MAKSSKTRHEAVKERLKRLKAEQKAASVVGGDGRQPKGKRSQKTDDSWHDREMQDDEGDQPTIEGISEDFALAVSARPSETVASLLERYIPQIPREGIEELEAALRGAQLKPPLDKDEFVAGVNRLLDVFELRIRAEDGGLYRLRVLPGATGRGHIQLRDLSKGRGFKNAVISVVPENGHAASPQKYQKNEK